MNLMTNAPSILYEVSAMTVVQEIWIKGTVSVIQEIWFKGTVSVIQEIWFKGTVSVIPSDPSFKYCN